MAARVETVDTTGAAQEEAAAAGVSLRTVALEALRTTPRAAAPFLGLAVEAVGVTIPEETAAPVLALSSTKRRAAPHDL